MKKLNHRPQETEVYIEALPAIPEKAIFAQKDGKIVGVIEPYQGRGCYLRLYPNQYEYFGLTVQSTIQQAEKNGYTFYWEE